MKKLLLVLCVVFLATAGQSQDLKIGVRTGLSYFKLLGELEANETQSLASGFHFAITGTYRLTESFYLRTELCYIQKSSLQEYDRFKTIFNIPTPDGLGVTRAIIEGGNLYSLKRTFNIFSIPVHAVYRPTKKIELFGGIDFDFVAGVVGQGRIDFDNGLPPGEGQIFYEQTLSYNYGSDIAGTIPRFDQSRITIDYDWDNDGETEEVTMPKTLTAYFYNDTDEGKAYSTFDMALSGGVAYFINPGLYLRATANYGLLDSSKAEFDSSLQDFNIDGSYIFRDDKDNKIGFQISMGFQF